jgi:enterochelin esterase-like enzyme
MSGLNSTLKRIAQLGYPPTGDRDLRLDFLRGLAVLAMVVDHFGGWSPLHILTGGNRFFTSAAEAFVFLSGLVTGLVYGRVALRDGLPVALNRLLARAATLYVLAVSLTLLGLRTSLGGEQLDPLPLLWSVFSLHRTGYLVDVPLLYTLLLLGAQVALLLLHQGRTVVLLALSWAVWLGYQLFPDQTGLPWPIEGNGLFHLASWQVLFFTGMVLGFHRHRLRRVSPARQWLLLGIASLGMAALLVLFGNPQVSALDVQERLFSKADVRVGRLVASVVVFGWAFLFTSCLWVPLERSIAWLVLPMGQHALYAYTAHVVLALGLRAALGSSAAVVDGSPALSALVQLAVVWLIWLAIRLRVLFPTRETQRWWSCAPAPLAVACVVFAQPAPAVGVRAKTETPAAELRIARLFGTPVTQLAVAAPTVNPVSTPVATARFAVGDLREVVFSSAALGRTLSYYAYVPPDYERTQQRYPVLVMLHGGGGSKDEWPAYGLISALDRLIAGGVIEPLIVVLPQGDRGYWVNQAEDGPRWADYVVQDVLGSIDGTFRTRADADHRAIGGLSMGGAGALQLAFNHPDVFHVVAAHSPSLHLDDGTFAVLGSGPQFDQREPLRLATLAPGLERLRIWIDAGEQDPWLERDRQLHQTLVERGIDHQWHVLGGGHEGSYWQANVERYLEFYDAALNRGRLD